MGVAEVARRGYDAPASLSPPQGQTLMGRTVRRFEVLLPLHLNDGAPVPHEWVADTLSELEARFGAGSYETQTIAGRWQYEGACLP